MTTEIAEERQTLTKALLDVSASDGSLWEVWVNPENPEKEFSTDVPRNCGYEYEQDGWVCIGDHAHLAFDCIEEVEAFIDIDLPRIIDEHEGMKVVEQDLEEVRSQKLWSN